MISKSGFEYTPVVFQDGISEIDLESLFELYYEDLPYLVDARNCIYLITCIPNGKVYVGETQYLYDRFAGRSGFSHMHRTRFNEDHPLYNDINDLGECNFKLEILEINLETPERKFKEVYYIDKFKSYCREDSTFGYNRTLGGYDSSQLNSPEAYETNRNNHGGVLSIHTEEAKALANQNRTLTKLFDAIEGRFWIVEERGLELNVNNYIFKGDYYRNHWTHIRHLLQRYDLLIDDERCTDKIYSILKGVLDYCQFWYPDWTKIYLNTKCNYESTLCE